MANSNLPKYIDQGKRTSNAIAMTILTLVAILLLVVSVLLVYLGILYNRLQQVDNNTQVHTRPNDKVEYIQDEDIPQDAPTFVPPTNSPVPSPTPTLMPEMEENLINILVLGCDSREQGVYEDARSDVNIILTIDKVNQSIKITSLMRDILVYYPDFGDYQRINYALRYYDDPAGVKKIVEHNFDIDIDHYMLTDFFGMAKLIDILGGVEVNASKAEIENMNDILWNLNELYEYDDLRQDFFVGDTGDIVLTGRQAVAYMRVRKVGADYERVQRQYEVLSSLKHKLSTMGFLEINNIIVELPNLLVTDMRPMEMLKVAGTLYKLRDSDMQQARVPFDGCYKPSTYNKMWILDLDFDKNKKLLHEFIYGTE